MKKYKVELTGYQWMLLFATLDAHVLAGEDNFWFVFFYNKIKNSLSFSNMTEISIIEVRDERILEYKNALLRTIEMDVLSAEEKILVGQALNYLDKLIG